MAKWPYIVNAVCKLCKIMVSKITFVGFSDVPESFLSSQNHKPFELESSKIFSSQSQSHDLVESSLKNCRVTSSH